MKPLITSDWQQSCSSFIKTLKGDKGPITVFITRCASFAVFPFGLL